MEIFSHKILQITDSDHGPPNYQNDGDEAVSMAASEAKMSEDVDFLLDV